MKNKNKRNIPLIICGIAALVLVIVMVIVLRKNEKDASIAVKEKADGETSYSDAVGAGGSMEAYRTLNYNGEIYKYDPEIRTVLFLGVDNDQSDYKYVGTAGHADCIELFIINEKKGTVRMLTIPRECMVDVETYSPSGTYLGTANEQLTVQYSFGDSPGKSCWLMKKAVSSLLNDIPINSYVSVNLEGIQDLTEYIGGVSVTMTEDHTDIDPAFQKGAVVDLKGELAEKFVRKRDITQFGSNEQRMERQGVFFHALADKLKKNGSKSYIASLMDHAGGYLTTDMDVDEADSMIRCSLTDEKLMVPGERVSGGENLPEEYIVDKTELTGLLAELFYVRGGQEE